MGATGLAFMLVFRGPRQAPAPQDVYTSCWCASGEAGGSVEQRIWACVARQDRSPVGATTIWRRFARHCAFTAPDILSHGVSKLARLLVDQRASGPMARLAAAPQASHGSFCGAPWCACVKSAGREGNARACAPPDRSPAAGLCHRRRAKCCPGIFSLSFPLTLCSQWWAPTCPC